MIEINFEALDQIICRALEEDCGVGDLTTSAIVSNELMGRGEFIAKQDLMLAGWPVVVRTFQRLSSSIATEANFRDSDLISKGSIIGQVQGQVAKLLTGERVALNFLQRLSGIATQTRQFVEAVRGTKAAIVDTRKTTPGLRILEKYAVRVGGGKNHRFGLFDGILIKENHITAAGGIAVAVQLARAAVDHLKKIEVEVTSLREVGEALDAKADVILLDNMSVTEVREACDRVRGRALLEVSGGIHLENIREYAQAGIDFISVGALTHSVRSVDISLELKL